MLLTLADLIGFNYVRTGTPEYIRMIERGTLRTFGKDACRSRPSSPGSCRCSSTSWWWHFGKWFARTDDLAND